MTVLNPVMVPKYLDATISGHAYRLAKFNSHAVQRKLHQHRQAKRIHGNKLLLLHLTPDIRERESTISREGID